MRVLIWTIKRFWLIIKGKPCTKKSLQIYLANSMIEATYEEEKFLIEAILQGMAGTIDTHSEKGKKQIALLDVINDLLQKKALIHKNDTFISNDFV